MIPTEKEILMREKQIFDLPYSEKPRIAVTISYMDGSTRSFDNEDWNTFKEGIKKNLYDRGYIEGIILETFNK